MRRLALALVMLALAPVAAVAAVLTVPLDQAVRLTLRGAASDVIVGNPEVAAVQIADSRHVVITGKKTGVTNLIITDAHGRPIVNRQIAVTTAQSGEVYVTSGKEIKTWSCTAQCVAEPAPLTPYEAAQVAYMQAVTSTTVARAAANPTGTP